jgi:TatA/E family protein of Tat protein translocase
MLEPFTMQLAGVRGFEWIILGAIILALFLGVKKIPEFAKSFGRASGEFEKAKIEMRKELERAKKPILKKDENSSQLPTHWESITLAKLMMSFDRQ